MDLKFDTTQEASASVASSRPSRPQINLFIEPNQLEYRDRQMYKVNKIGEKMEKNNVNIMSRNLSSGSFYQQQNFYSERSQTTKNQQHEPFTFQPDSGDKQKT